MIGKTTSGTSFKGLIDYLTDPDKMDWLEQRGINTESTNLIAEKMQLTARQSVRTQKPVYHVSLSWSKYDRPNKEQMKQVADQFLDHMRLTEYQSVIIAHKDKKHPHIHIAINRVHPESGKAWEPYLFEGTGRERTIGQTDYQRIEEFLRTTEKEYGWKITPGKHAGQWQREFDSRAPEIWEVKQQTKAEKVAAGLGMEDIDGRSVKERALELKDELYRCRSFKEFDNILASSGLWVQPKGQGMIITDGNQSIKASSVSRGFSGSRLESKFEESLKGYVQKRNATVDLADGFAALKDLAMKTERSELQSIKNFIEPSYKRSDASLSRRTRYESELTSAQEEIRASFRQVYVNSKEAYQEVASYVEEVGLEEGLASLASSPEEFGLVKDTDSTGRACEAIRGYFNVQSRYSTQIVNLSKEERSHKIERQRARKNNFGRVYNNVSSRLRGKLFQETEAGRATDNSVQKVMAVSRALNQIAKNPKASPVSLAKDAGVTMVGKMDSEAGKAISSSVMNASQYFRNVGEIISNPTTGSVKLVKSVMQLAIRSMGTNGRETALGR